MSPDGPRTRTPRTASSSRESILTAAEHLFAERGYDGTSTNRIAEAAGVTRTLIFHYFPTKEQILVALLRERGADRILDGVDRGRGSDVAGALVELSGRVRSRLNGSARILRIIMLQRPLHPFVDKFFAVLLERLDRLVTDTVVGALPATLEGPPAPVDPPPEVEAVVRMFAAVLFRDAVLERFSGAEAEVSAVAGACARALHGPDPVGSS